jgi:phosphoribosyl 1,2-cyclic phosphodiesterase
MEFALLGSGSKGNGMLLRAHGRALLIDCGFTLRETLQRLEKLALAPTDIAAVLVTHEHGDHLGGVAPLSRKYRIPVWMTHGTYHGARGRVRPSGWLYPEQPLSFAEMQVMPVAVPHDAREACQFIVTESTTGDSLGILTDLGHISAHLPAHYRNCHTLILESNHDPDLLMQGPYPPSLKRRVAGHWGHLSNQQAAAFISDLLALDAELQQVVLCHLSEQNNDPERALHCAGAVLRHQAVDLQVASQDSVLEWRSVRPVTRHQSEGAVHEAGLAV